MSASPTDVCALPGLAHRPWGAALDRVGVAAFPAFTELALVVDLSRCSRSLELAERCKGPIRQRRPTALSSRCPLCHSTSMTNADPLARGGLGYAQIRDLVRARVARGELRS